MMNARMRLALAACCALAVGGCFPTWDVKETFTLNPARSGKVAFDARTNVRIDPMGKGWREGEVKDPRTAARKTVEKMIAEDAEGVEAWADVSYAIEKDGRIRFRGVAYFPNSAELKLPWGTAVKKWKRTDDGMELEAEPKVLPEGAAGAMGGMPAMNIRIHPLEDMPGAAATTRPAAAPPEPKKLTDAEVREEMLRRRVGYQQVRPLLFAFVGGLKLDTTYVLPGKVAGLRFVLDGQRMIAGFDKIHESDELLAAAIRNEESPWKEKLSREAFKVMTGREAEDFRVKVAGPLKPLFDYKAESAKAKAAQAEMFKKLNINPNPQPPQMPQMPPGFEMPPMPPMPGMMPGTGDTPKPAPPEEE
jgi:hypothetical protein